MNLYIEAAGRFGVALLCLKEISQADFHLYPADNSCHGRSAD